MKLGNKEATAIFRADRNDAKRLCYYFHLKQPLFRPLPTCPPSVPSARCCGLLNLVVQVHRSSVHSWDHPSLQTSCLKSFSSERGRSHASRSRSHQQLNYSSDTPQMFTNERRQQERTGKYGTPRQQYLQELVSQFQNAEDEATKEKTVANLANFAYDPYNYASLRQLNVLELFLDCITEPNEKLVEFGIGGVCNACADPHNSKLISQCGGVELAIQCLSSPVKNTVNYALGALYFLCEDGHNRQETFKDEVLGLIKGYADANEVSVSFSNLAKALLDKHLPGH